MCFKNEAIDLKMQYMCFHFLVEGSKTVSLGKHKELSKPSENGGCIGICKWVV